MIIEHGSEETVTGQLIRNLCEGVVLQCGVGGDIFDLHSSFCTWVEENWVWPTIRSMEDLNINITHSVEQLVKWKIDDVFILENIAESKNFNSKELYDINMVRLYMRVTTLSDITLVDGSKIREDAIRGERFISCSSSFYEWPRIPKPSRKMIRIWEHAIKITFTSERLDIKGDINMLMWTHDSI